jgi:hypothetical protein
LRQHNNVEMRVDTIKCDCTRDEILKYLNLAEL